MVYYKSPQTFFTGINTVNRYMDCLMLWEKGMLRGSQKTVSSSVVCKVKLLFVFRLPTLLLSVYFLLGLAGKLLKEENYCFMSTFHRSITYSQDVYTCKSKVSILMNFHKVITPKEPASRMQCTTWPFHAIFQPLCAQSRPPLPESNGTNWFCHVFEFYINRIIQ